MIKGVVFIAGGVLMSLEIAASRALAPYYGSTIFVWSSLISVLLTALACGYYVGGVWRTGNLLMPSGRPCCWGPGF
ncbi:hypothetical protein [Candidatus Velamenicoccus archaeovorus]|uniref:hypothetical protein n=1 Tax=Velamenicoccus archaeovorus TaxID=1930593 RepID=UPI000FFE4669|nr:hypothetical protein [Candidatus Velamenicoccus archaeovorus]